MVGHKFEMNVYMYLFQIYWKYVCNQRMECCYANNYIQEIDLNLIEL